MSGDSKGFLGFVEKMKEKFGQIHFKGMGSSLKICYVASGEADCYIRRGPTYEWDTAAGQIILEEAQGLLANFETKKPLSYNKSDLINPHFFAARKEVYPHL